MKGTDPVCEKSKLVKKLLNGIIRFFQFCYFNLLQQFKVLPNNSKKIFFTLDDDMLYRADDGMGRYAYLTLNAFSRAGYNVYLYKKIDFLGFIKLGLYGRFIYYIKNLKIVQEIPANTKELIYAFDTVHPALLSKRWEKLVYVNILKPTFCSVGETVWIPYYFHPHMYRLEQCDKILSLRNQKRTVRIFFGGNASETYYTNPNLTHRYGQMTRKEGINALLELKENVVRVDDIKRFLEMLKIGGYAHKGFILETNRCGNTRLDEWFEIIASSDFFMCFSGTDLPMCHNSIESMAVGTIPIISYPDWFFPPLEHGKNAIIYSGKEDLKVKVQEILKMNREEIQQMQKNAAAYYDQYLSNGSFMHHFRMDQGEVCTLMLHPRLVSTSSEEEKAKSLFNNLKSILPQKAAGKKGFQSAIRRTLNHMQTLDSEC